MTARRLTPPEIDIILNALDEYALKEDLDRASELDEAIGRLADALVDPEYHPVSEIIILLDDSTEGLEEMPDDSTATAPEEDAEAEEASDELDADEDDESDGDEEVLEA